MEEKEVSHQNMSINESYKITTTIDSQLVQWSLFVDEPVPESKINTSHDTTITSKPDTSHVKEIKLNNEYTVKVDAADFDIISKYKWHVTFRGDKKPQAAHNYLVGEQRYQGEKILMHRMLLNVLPGFEVDHVNRDTLDNRRSNLRVCDRSLNRANTLKRKTSQWNYKGVRHHRGWEARITVGGKSKTVKCRSEIEAAHAYDEMAYKAYGEFANLNFPKT